MATRLFNAIVASAVSGVITPITGHQPDRTVFVAIAGDDQVQVEVSPDGTNWFDLGSELAGPGNFTVTVNPRLHIRLDATVNSDTVSAWVA